MAKPLHWQTFEYEHRERSPDWFWAVGIITIALSVTAIILNNVLFAFVVILSGFVLSLYAARPPKEIDVVIDEKGVRIEQIFYPFYTLESFWIDDESEQAKILIKSQRLLMPYIVIPIAEEVDLKRLQNHLHKYLPEVFHSESVFHRLMEYLGF